jgi:hypothetical protein
MKTFYLINRIGISLRIVKRISSGGDFFIASLQICAGNQRLAYEFGLPAAYPVNVKA